MARETSGGNLSKDDPFSGRPEDAGFEPTIVEPNDRLVGKTIAGRYSILTRIAKGGTAVVYRALDTTLNREVAIKILHEHLENKHEVVERFRKEAVLIAQLRHPNILTVFDFLEYEGRAVLVVEYMPGITLATLVNGTDRIPEEIVLMITLEILKGLRAAHQKEITHRDIKPANVLVHSELGIKISDFGLAKILDSDDGLTKEGIFVGTPSFSSPEQIEGKPVDHRSDLFSLGLTTYMLATRSHAFKKKGDSTTTVWFKTVRGTFEAARNRNPDLSAEFELILNKALEVTVEKRYASAEEMIKDVEALLQKKGLAQYQLILKTFLLDPKTFSALPLSNQRKKLSRKYWIGLGILSLVTAAALYFFNQPNPNESPDLADFKSTAPLDSVLPKMETPAAVPPSNTSEASPEVSAPPLHEVQKPSKAHKKSDVEKVSLKPKGAEISFAVPLNKKSLILLSSDDALPNFRVNWSGPPNFILASDPIFSKIVQKGQSKFHFWEIKDLRVGNFFWRGGTETGQIEVQNLETYRSKIKSAKRPVIVSSQFGDVDLELNPWTQDLQLNWQAGPDAHSYRLELSTNNRFSNLLFSTVAVTKSVTIERLWDKSATLFWRVAYLDESRNVFLIDPVRKINLVVKGRSPSFDLLSPQPGESVGSDIDIKAIGPAKGVWGCASVSDKTSFSKWEGIDPQNSVWAGKILRSPDAKWIICEASIGNQATYFTIPIRAQ
ncbi:MAG: hypothetical protein JWQ35_1520 [Bacteriovoracaceae bacterium]|nr:hypothetical protein [Bacteriovoracaceae bacterium]